MMTRKHYNALANAIKETTEAHKLPTNNPKQVILKTINKDRLIFRLCNIFKNDNINFNYTRFENACKSQGELI